MVALNTFCSPSIWSFGVNQTGQYCMTRGIAKKKLNIQGQSVFGVQCDVYLGAVMNIPPNGGYLLKIMLLPTQQLVEDRVCRNKTEIQTSLKKFGLGYLVS